MDESAEQLGTHLVLPAWLEKRRAELTAILPPLDLAGCHMESLMKDLGFVHRFVPATRRNTPALLLLHGDAYSAIKGVLQSELRIVITLAKPVFADPGV